MGEPPSFSKSTIPKLFASAFPRKARYLNPHALVWDKLEMCDILRAMRLEYERSLRGLRILPETPWSASTLIRSCKNGSFDFEAMILDQYSDGLTYRDLQKLHGIGAKRISAILREKKTPSKPGKRNRAVKDKKIYEEYLNLNGNASATAIAMNIHRTTVSAAVRRCMALCQDSQESLSPAFY